MAQLPPKIPNMPPDLSNRHHISMQHNNPCWVDDFLDFSSAKRNAHRRSASDSGAYLPEKAVGRKNGFDDDHLPSMFTDEISPAAAQSSSNPSTPSDHNGEKQPENGTEEAQTSNPNDRIVDPKRVKRILANRQSAQRSRVKKLQYISELERHITSLQAEVSVLSPRVAFLDHQRLLLNVDNSALKQRIAALQQDKIFKEAHEEALKREIERLRQVHERQNMDNPTEATELMLNV